MIAPGAAPGGSGSSPFAGLLVAASALLSAIGSGCDNRGERLHHLGPVAGPNGRSQGREGRCASSPLAVSAAEE